MQVDKEIFISYLNSLHIDDYNKTGQFVDCEIIEVWEIGRKDIIFSAKRENGEMCGQYTVKTEKYKEFARNLKIEELTK